MAYIVMVRRFTGLVDCILKTANGPGGMLSLYNGFGTSVLGIVAYRAVQFGTFDTFMRLNPHKNDESVMGRVSTFFFAQTALLCSAVFT